MKASHKWWHYVPSAGVAAWHSNSLRFAMWKKVTRRRVIHGQAIRKFLCKKFLICLKRLLKGDIWAHSLQRWELHPKLDRCCFMFFGHVFWTRDLRYLTRMGRVSKYMFDVFKVYSLIWIWYMHMYIYIYPLLVGFVLGVQLVSQYETNIRCEFKRSLMKWICFWMLTWHRFVALQGPTYVLRSFWI